MGRSSPRGWRIFLNVEVQMDPLLMLPIIIALFSIFLAHTQQKEQEGFEDLVSRLELLSEASRARLRRLRRLSRFNLYANIQGLREFDR